MTDLIPFTPWIRPHGAAIQEMIEAAESIIELLRGEIRTVIRGHGDYRLNHWEINLAHEEIPRYKNFIELIHLKKKQLIKFLETPRTIEAVAQFINPRYLKYNQIMNRFFIAPAFTWAFAYCFLLKEEGLIIAEKRQGQYRWRSVKEGRFEKVR